MKISENKSEQLHPQDKRVNDTPFVLIDTPQFFDQVKAETNAGNRSQFPPFQFSNILFEHFNYCYEKQSPQLMIKPEITSPAYMLNGDIKCIIQDGEIVLHPQQQIIFHEGILDKIEAINDADIILTNYKTREKRLYLCKYYYEKVVKDYRRQFF